MKFKHNPLLSKAMNSYNMNILDCCHCVLDDSWRSKNACAGFTRIYYVIDGSAFLHLKDETIEMRPNHIYILPTGLNFGYECEKSLEKVFIHVKLCDRGGNDTLAAVNRCVVFDEMETEIDTVKKLIKSGDTLSALRLKALLFDRLTAALEKGGGSLGKIREYSALTTSAIRFIEENLHSDLTVRDISRSLYVSESHLNKVFKEELGVTPGKYVSNKILLRAEELLRRTTESVRCISEQLGFCDQFYFSRCFSACYGVSPLQYRKNLSHEGALPPE